MWLVALLPMLFIIRPSDSKNLRSAKARHDFVRQVRCPATQAHRLPCPGYVIDHVKPLACGGPDEPSNMQWQPIADAKAKDKWERKTCAK